MLFFYQKSAIFKSISALIALKVKVAIGVSFFDRLAVIVLAIKLMPVIFTITRPLFLVCFAYARISTRGAYIAAGCIEMIFITALSMILVVTGSVFSFIPVSVRILRILGSSIHTLALVSAIKALKATLCISVRSLFYYRVSMRMTLAGKLLPVFSRISLPFTVYTEALIATVKANATTLSVISVITCFNTDMRGGSNVATGGYLKVFSSGLVIKILATVGINGTGLVSADITESVYYGLVHMSSLGSNACILTLTLCRIPMAGSIALPFVTVIFMRALFSSARNESKNKHSNAKDQADNLFHNQKFLR